MDLSEAARDIFSGMSVHNTAYKIKLACDNNTPYKGYRFKRVLI